MKPAAYFFFILGALLFPAVFFETGVTILVPLIGAVICIGVGYWFYNGAVLDTNDTGGSTDGPKGGGSYTPPSGDGPNRDDGTRIR